MQINNLNSKSTTYSTDSYAYVPTPMSSSQQYTNSEFSNVAPCNSSSILVSENTTPVALIQETGNLKFNPINFFSILFYIIPTYYHAMLKKYL